MYIISSRRYFSDPDRLSASGHTIREIDFSNDSVSHSFKDFGEFSARISGQRLLLLVHGYNNEQDEVYDAYSVIERKVQSHLNNEYDLVIGYSWPGGDTELDWWSSKRRANAVARRFRFLIHTLVASAHALDMMSHSLGARVIFKALKQASTINGNSIVRNYFCTAASVDNEVLEMGEEFHTAIDKFDGIYVFHSRKDEILYYAYRAAEFDQALGLSGPEDK